MQPLLIGVDAGTTNVKVVAFTLDGKEYCHSTRSNPIERPQTNWAEQDMQRVWQRTAAAIRDVVDRLQTDDEIIGIGVTGQGDGCWLIDDNGEPVRNAILWSDGRATNRVETWQSDGTADRIYDICGNGVFPGASLPILCWLREHEPESFERVDTVFFCKDWLKYKLTGAKRSDLSDMSLPYLNIKQGDYTTEIGELVEMPELSDFLPPLAPATEVIGEVTADAVASTGLPEGTPVISGIIDIAASAFGSGAVSQGDSSSVIGTTSLNQTFLDEPQTEPSGVGFTLELGVNELYTRAMASMAGTPNVDWMVKELADTEDFDEIEAAISDLPIGCNGLLYHPFLSNSGERSPFLKPTARAQFTGLSPTHTQDHLLRAIYEGVALAMRDCYDHIPRQSDAIYMSGGGAQSDFWCQMFADCLGTDVLVPEGTEFGAKGVALLAGVALDEYVDIETAVKETTVIERRYSPVNERTQQYDKWYSLYTDVYEAMFEIWDQRRTVLSELETMDEGVDSG